MSRNLALLLRFDGRAFHGWQVQKDHPTVMSALQETIQSITGEFPLIKGSSRTDAGVSALSYCASFRTESPIPCHRLLGAINARLPKTIACLSCREETEEFHARYSAKGKRYCYRILNSPVRDPFWDGLALHWWTPIDVELLHQEAQALIGKHDFAAFRNMGSNVEGSIRTIFDCSVTRRGELIEFHVSGDGFLYNMVRIMAGTLIEIARGSIAPGTMAEIIASCDRNRAGMTAPACGLILEEVFY